MNNGAITVLHGDHWCLAFQMVDALDWCLCMGIKTVSVYAFSVENFKRSRDEVEDLMDLAADKLEEILRVSFCGLLHLFLHAFPSPY